MTNFKNGDRVKWVKKMACVPHPEGKTDQHGNVLPVFRDTEILGRVIDKATNNKWTVRPESAESCKDKICGERYYDVRVAEVDLTLI